MQTYDELAKAYDAHPDEALEQEIMLNLAMLRTLAENELPGMYSSDGLLTAACVLAAGKQRVTVKQPDFPVIP